MAGDNKTRQADPLTEQMDRLAADLQARGVAPGRDLWPDIDRSISAAERHQLRRAPRPLRLGRQLAAAAAVVVLAAGWWGLQRHAGPVPGADPVASPAPTATGPSDMVVVERALAELNQALADDPNNRSLINLALMLHQSRGRMMRQHEDLPFRGS